MASPEDIKQKVVEILMNDFRIPAAKITDDATFRGNLGMDSLDAVDLIYLIKKTFALKVQTQDFRELHTVKQVVDFVVKQSTT